MLFFISEISCETINFDITKNCSYKLFFTVVNKENAYIICACVLIHITRKFP